MQESKSRAVGRPSLYNEELQAKADEYLLAHEDQGDVIPSHAGLACWLGVSKPTIYEWAKIHSGFSNTLQSILVKQETIALNKGLSGAFNATITKLVLANHGYSDKQEIKHAGSIETKQTRDMSDEELEEMIAKRNGSGS